VDIIRCTGGSAAVRFCFGHRPFSRCCAPAGAAWASRTSNAPWGRRQGHTSVVNAAGAIYVIGGYRGGTVFQDVWVSTDGGARAGPGHGTQGKGGGARGADTGYSVYQGV
jgi:hypothetical protein